MLHNLWRWLACGARLAWFSASNVFFVYIYAQRGGAGRGPLVCPRGFLSVSVSVALTAFCYLLTLSVAAAAVSSVITSNIASPLLFLANRNLPQLSWRRHWRSVLRWAWRPAA